MAPATPDREIVANRRTLEQKISEQGPKPDRVDPQLLGLALEDHLRLNRLQEIAHAENPKGRWFANIGTKPELYQPKLDTLAVLYQTIIGGGFGNLIGDALEIITFRCIQELCAKRPGLAFNGYFHLDRPKNAEGRFEKIQPPKFNAGNSTVKEADFLIYGFPKGVLCVECKNLREWSYPTERSFKELILKAHDLDAIPVIVARRIHYTAVSNLLEPAGIIAHESYYQYYPSDQIDLATRVSDKRSLGFTDVTATEDPHARTRKFFTEHLPTVVEYMGARWSANRSALVDYARGNQNLAQLYNAIGSRAAGNWIEPTPDAD